MSTDFTSKLDPRDLETIENDILKHCRGKGKETEQKVLYAPKSADIKAYVIDQVKQRNANASGVSKFKESFSKKQNDSYYIFHCIRGSSKKPSEGSARNVGCKAYISFKVYNCYKNIHAHIILMRVNERHCGHDLDDVTDKHVNPINPILQTKIRKWLELGVKPDVILIQAHKWALENGYENVHDREYYVTPDDIKNIRKSFMISQQLDKNDAVSVQGLLSRHKNNVIYYKEFISGKQDFILVIMTEKMQQRYVEYGKKVIYIDSTANTNDYGFPLCSLIVQDRFGRGVPAVHIICSTENQGSLITALEAVKARFQDIQPR